MQRLLVLKNLDDYHQWPIKHRHWTFDLIEDASHEIWVSTQDLRLFYDRFPSDKVLKEVYYRSMLYAKDSKTYYLAERVMRTELRKSKSYSSHTDVLKFLDWYERNVTQVVTKQTPGSSQYTPQSPRTKDFRWSHTRQSGTVAARRCHDAFHQGRALGYGATF
jgi:hypothetical protein